MLTTCQYCAQDFDCPTVKTWVSYQVGYIERPRRSTCSEACQKRQAVWRDWIRETSEIVTLGDVNRAIKTGPVLPPARGIVDIARRFIA